jgi:hypothetical protein
MRIHSPQITGSAANTNIVTTTQIGSLSALSASYAATASYSNALTVGGTITAQTLVVQTITSSVDFITGSARFGSTTGNTHEFTGSVLVSGSQSINGTLGVAVGGVTELNVQQTGVTLGSVIGDVHRITGSLLTSGSVGIGTADLGPDGLSLSTQNNYSWSEGSGNAYAVLFRQRNSAATVVASGYKRSNTAAFASSFGTSIARAAIAVGSNNGSIAFFTDTATNVANGTDMTPTERVTITNSGNVGIGTTSPGRPLTISSTTADKVYLTGGTVQNGILLDSVGSSAQYYYGSGNNLLVGGDQGAVVAFNVSSSTAAIFFDSSNNIRFGATPTTERMRITSTGNVGIGTTAPDRDPSGTRSLAISGGGSLAASLDLYGNARNFAIFTGGAGALGFFDLTAGSERMRITSGGNVGIGTTEPDRFFHINANTSTTTAIQKVQNVGTGDAVTEYRIPGVSWYIGNDASDAGKFKIGQDPLGTSDRFVIADGGNVGIGSSSPGVRLVNSGATLASVPTLGSGTIGANAILSANGLYGLYTGVSSEGWVWQQVQRNDANSAVYPLILNPSGGNVYVGGTGVANSPKFSVIGSGVWDGGCIGLSNTGAGGQVYTIFSTSNAFSQGGSNLLFYNATLGTNNLILYSNGNYDFMGSDVSDRRLKQDIEDLNYGLDEIMELSPKSYHLKSKNNLEGNDQTTLRKRYGFIAQEIQPVLPDAITGEETETDYLGLDYNGVLAVAVKAIQELSAKNDALEARLAALESA